VTIDPHHRPDNPDVPWQMVRDLATQREAHERRYQRVQRLTPEPEKAGKKQTKRRGHGRQPLTRTLTRERIEHELSEAERAGPSCARPMERIGEEVSERLEYVPASLTAIEEARAKYACRRGGALKTAPKPAQPIEKGVAGASPLAQVVVAKYADHCPPGGHLPAARRGAFAPDDVRLDAANRRSAGAAVRAVESAGSGIESGAD